MEGDSFEAAFHLRAYRATLKRRYYSELMNTREMIVERRISSTFRESPGGQILGPTRDYSMRLLEPSLLRQTLGSIDTFLERMQDSVDPAKFRGVTTFSKVIDLFQAEGIMRRETADGDDMRVVDVTREAIKFPAPRSAVLQMLARAETGGLMCMGYSTMRGFAVAHGTIGELRVGQVPVRVVDAVAGGGAISGRSGLPSARWWVARRREKRRKGPPHLSVGYGLVLRPERNQGHLHGDGGERAAHARSGEPREQPGVRSVSHGMHRGLRVHQSF